MKGATFRLLHLNLHASVLAEKKGGSSFDGRGTLTSTTSKAAFEGTNLSTKPNGSSVHRFPRSLLRMNSPRVYRKQIQANDFRFREPRSHSDHPTSLDPASWTRRRRAKFRLHFAFHLFLCTKFALPNPELLLHTSEGQRHLPPRVQAPNRDLLR